MRQLDPALQAHLDSGATTLAWCWRLTRTDGLVLGFTDHDRALAFDGTTFEATTAFSASEIKASIGLGVDDLEVTSALRADSLNDDDLAAGLFDDARIEIFRVNWAVPTQRLLVRVGSIGEVRRTGAAFTAEIRGLAHYLQQPQGRLYQRTCDAALGDSRCGVDLDQPAFKATASVTSSVGARSFVASALDSYGTGLFSRGRLVWTSGANAGRPADVKRHFQGAGSPMLELWEEPAHPIMPNDAFTVTAGCDKSIETCRARFANAVNFRGFPDLPGIDFITSYPNTGDPANDGAAR